MNNQKNKNNEQMDGRQKMGFIARTKKQILNSKKSKNPITTYTSDLDEINKQFLKERMLRHVTEIIKNSEFAQNDESDCIVFEILVKKLKSHLNDLTDDEKLRDETSVKIAKFIQNIMQQTYARQLTDVHSNHSKIELNDQSNFESVNQINKCVNTNISDIEKFTKINSILKMDNLQEEFNKQFCKEYYLWMLNVTNMTRDWTNWIAATVKEAEEMKNQNISNSVEWKQFLKAKTDEINKLKKKKEELTQILNLWKINSSTDVVNEIEMKNENLIKHSSISNTLNKPKRLRLETSNLKIQTIIPLLARQCTSTSTT